jgi:hypothetical protein
MIHNKLPGLDYANIVDNFIDKAVKNELNSKYFIHLSDNVTLISTVTRVHNQNYNDIIVYDKITKDILILLQGYNIFLFDCPDDVWLIFQALLSTRSFSNPFSYNHIPKAIAESRRFSIESLDKTIISSYIVEELINDRVLNVS